MRAQKDPRFQAGAPSSGPGGGVGPAGVGPADSAGPVDPSTSPPRTADTEARAPAAERAVPRTRAGSAWTALAVGMVVLLVVVVFILQNIHGVRVSFLFFDWKLPLAIDLLLAAFLGGLVVFLLGAVRMLQLRRAAQRNARR